MVRLSEKAIVEDGEVAGEKSLGLFSSRGAIVGPDVDGEESLHSLAECRAFRGRRVPYRSRLVPRVLQADRFDAAERYEIALFPCHKHIALGPALGDADAEALERVVKEDFWPLSTERARMENSVSFTVATPECGAVAFRHAIYAPF